eukprot:TRINITY_DN14680_c1_g1_i5.p1 TRINITY_DN14680_c1_g1~~TRINITY_DN14680_c1_g1_i5.p1  ORF type:complete len:943 (-),score=97.18 TRINITY_DN14680_c1_g1_i5:209-3037(-)
MRRVIAISLLAALQAWGELVTWTAPQTEPVHRRLQQTLTVQLNVLKKDTFGTAPPKLDVSFRDASGRLVQASFSGSEGNAGRKLPNLRHGMSATIVGSEQSDTTQANALKAQMEDTGLLSGRLARGQTLETTAGNLDKRPVFEVASFTAESGTSGSNGRRMNAPAENKAIVVLFQPCGNTLQASVTQDRVRSALFSNNDNSFNQALSECSRGGSQFTGEVVGPIDGCPSSEDYFTTYEAIHALMTKDTRWQEARYKMMVLPSNWGGSIGVGTVGGGLTWYDERYVSDPVMYLHEVGHNWRLHHANGPYAYQEYQDTSSSMGYCCDMRCYNFLHSWQLGFSSYFRELSHSEILNSATGISLTIPALGSTAQSGVKILSDNSRSTDAYIVLSFRGTTGYDRHLIGTQYANKVQVSHWDGDNTQDAQPTHLLHTVARDQTILISDTDRVSSRLPTQLKMTVKSGSSSSSVDVLLCAKLLSDDENAPTPCSGGGATAPTTSTSTPPTSVLSEWSSYFESSPAGSSAPVAALGCKGQFCSSMRLRYRTDISFSTATGTRQEVAGDIGSAICQSSQVVTKVTCVNSGSGSGCTLVVECNSPTTGRLSGYQTEMSFFPGSLHATEDSSCPASAVLVGVRCASAQCGQKFLICEEYIAGGSTCVPHCSSLGWNCGDDGCGGSCGTCSSTGTQPSFCHANVGRCVQTGVSKWSSSSSNMSEPNLVASGMGCDGRYCESVQLYLLGISADASNFQRSSWISDNSGARYPWNSGESAKDQIADCPAGTAISFAECSGKYCDNLRFHCAKPLQWTVSTDEPHVTEWFSEESPGRMDCPQGTVVTGVECQAVKTFCLTKCGDYCDNKRLRCRPIYPERTGAAILGVRTNLTSSVAPSPPASTSWWQDSWNTTKNVFSDLISKAGETASAVDGAQQSSLWWAAVFPLGWVMHNVNQ